MGERVETDGRWHAAAVALLGVAALWNGWDWLTGSRMPDGDFPGYVAQVERVRDAVLAHGVVPRWCGECYGGASTFTGHLKEILLLPLAVAFDPVFATKLAFLMLKFLAGLGLYGLIVSAFRAPAAGIVAGYGLAFGAVGNHQLEHLDVVLATALLPPTVWVAKAYLRRGSVGLGAALGVLAACQLVNHWVLSLSVPLLVAALAGFAPWRGEGPHPWRDLGVARRQIARVAGALGVFVALAASTLVWTAADAGHHRLVPEESTARQRMLYIERSPFLFVNRANVLGPWLAAHQPPGFDLPRSDGGRRYLGVVAIAVIAVGLWFGVRRGDARWRRWFGVAATLFGVQYWLSLGPRTWWWEVGTSLHFSEAALSTVHFASIAAGCGMMGVAAVWARRRGFRVVHGIGFALGVVALALATSLWNGVAFVFPMFEVQRSPGRFFDLAPVWWALLFGVALVAVERSVGPRRAALAGVVVVGLAVIADFAPSRSRYEAGFPLEPLRRTRALVEDLPGEDGTLRIGLPIAYRPVASWVLAAADAGHAWGWLPWQSGRDWADYYARALYQTHGPRPDGRGPIDPDPELIAAARIQHLLVPTRMRPPPGWRRLGATEVFALWEGPEVADFARGFRETLWLDDPTPAHAPAWASRALAANVLLVAAPQPGEADDARFAALRDAARRVVRSGAPIPGRLAPAPPPVAARARRDGPERLEITIDAGESPAMVSISEGHHPWWRAEVDGEPAPVLRAHHAMMAVPVPAGAHRISMRFTPPLGVRAAEIVTATAWVTVLGFAGFVLAKGRKRTHG